MPTAYESLFEKVFGAPPSAFDNVASSSSSAGAGSSSISTPSYSDPSASSYEKWEIGSHASKGIGLDLTDFMNKLKQLYVGIEKDEIYPKAVRKGAVYLRDLIEAATPIRYTDLIAPQGKYKTKSGRHKIWHPPGQARRNVIVYKRKGGNSYYQGDVNANTSYLVGYEKSKAYYMYWREHGSKNQPARPVIRPIFDAHIDECMEIVLDYISKDMSARIKVA